MSCNFWSGRNIFLENLYMHTIKNSIVYCLLFTLKLSINYFYCNDSPNWSERKRSFMIPELVVQLYATPHSEINRPGLLVHVVLYYVYVNAFFKNSTSHYISPNSGYKTSTDFNHIYNKGDLVLPWITSSIQRYLILFNPKEHKSTHDPNWHCPITPSNSISWYEDTYEHKRHESNSKYNK